MKRSTMDLIHRVILGNELLAWAKAAAMAGLALALLLAAKRVILRKASELARRTETILDDLLVAALAGTRWFTLLAAALYAAGAALDLPARAGRAADALLVFCLLLQGAIWTSTAVGFLLDHAIRQREEGDAGGTLNLKALAFTAKVVVWSVFLLAVLANAGVNVTGLMTGLGIGGIAVALAVQNVLGDLFASLSIILDKPFEPGDFIIVGEFLGAVETIGLKTTRIRSLSGEQIIFSNSDLLKSRVRNYKRMAERRVAFTLGVTFQTPRAKLSVIPDRVREIVAAQPGTRFDRAHFKEIGESALTFEIVYYLLDPDFNTYMDVQQAINLEIMQRFEEDGIAFAYPTRTVILES
jgi:small-conductance mechanosensitive channel